MLLPICLCFTLALEQLLFEDTKQLVIPPQFCNRAVPLVVIELHLFGDTLFSVPFPPTSQLYNKLAQLI